MLLRIRSLTSFGAQASQKDGPSTNQCAAAPALCHAALPLTLSCIYAATCCKASLCCRTLLQGAFDLKGELPQVPANVRLVKGMMTLNGCNAVQYITVALQPSSCPCHYFGLTRSCTPIKQRSDGWHSLPRLV